MGLSDGSINRTFKPLGEGLQGRINAVRGGALQGSRPKGRAERQEGLFDQGRIRAQFPPRSGHAPDTMARPVATQLHPETQWCMGIEQMFVSLHPCLAQQREQVRVYQCRVMPGAIATSRRQLQASLAVVHSNTS